ncbi:MAG: hypothetical protein HZB42_07095 [Sphingobacteriales bacterium]|nr:hypothetical protein [Sphingobacteriales bacterium]
MYTPELIEELINCQKKITEGVKTSPWGRGYTKKEFKLSSIDDQYLFRGFMNQNDAFQEDYSIGLVYEPKGEKGRVCLLRVNGLHGGTKVIPHHAYCHEHTALAEDLNNGIKREKNIIKVDNYTTMEEAIQHYVKRINIVLQDRRKHFPTPVPPATTLFD